MSAERDHALDRLWTTVSERRGADPGESWTANLLSRGSGICAAKFGEEAVEAVIEAVRGDRQALVRESADVLYHLCVMLAASDASLPEVLEELDRRAGVSGLAEKAARER